MEVSFKRPLQDIISDLKKPLSKQWIKSKRKGGSNIDFMPWFRYAELADMYAPGWEKEITDVSWTDKRCTVRVKITIHAEEGSFSRESTGHDDDFGNKYGDPQSRAESMAFRRAWANMGLARELYEKDDIDYEVSGDGASTPPPAPHMRKVKTSKEKVKKIDVAAQVTEAEEMFEKMKDWANDQILQGKTIEYVQGTCREKMIPKMKNAKVKKAALEWVANEWEVAG